MDMSGQKGQSLVILRVSMQEKFSCNIRSESGTVLVRFHQEGTTIRQTVAFLAVLGSLPSLKHIGVMK